MNKKTKIFLKSLAQISHYWAKETIERIEPADYETENEARINGAIHSILVMFEGDSGANDFKSYDIKDGKTIIGENECLPSRYFEVFKNYKSIIKEGKND